MLLCALSVALAGTWTTVADGVDLYEETIAGPNRVWALFVDLSNPYVYLRTTMEGENGQTVSSWASNVGAVAATNADFFDYDGYVPTGLAVSRGYRWHDDQAWWNFMACNSDKSCVFDTRDTFTAVSPRWWNAVGGEHEALVMSGVASHPDDPYYSETPQPRTAVGLSADGMTMILVVVDGRSSASVGLTFWQMADLMVAYGAWDAMNLDGGGSSTMVAGGVLRNSPSDGAQRVVGSHLGVMVSSSVDARCALINGSWCDGTVYKVCEGGVYAEGDCGAYGLGCEEEGSAAFCVDPRCENGLQGNHCLDGTRIGGCTDGIYREADCAAYGLSCAEAYGDAWCASTFYQGALSASSWGAEPVSLRAGQSARAWVDLLNTGLTAWEPGTVYLAPIPRDQASPYADATWASPGRISTVSSSVPPGQVARFEVPIHGMQAGEGALSLGLVAEGVTWFADVPSGGGPRDGELSVVVRVVDGAAENANEGCGCGGATGPAGALSLLAAAATVMRRRRGGEDA